MLEARALLPKLTWTSAHRYGVSVSHGPLWSLLVEIFYTDYVALAEPVDGLGEDEARRRAAEFRGRFVPEGMPFVLNDDGSYEWTLNRFLRSEVSIMAVVPSLPLLDVDALRS